MPTLEAANQEEAQIAVAKKYVDAQLEAMKKAGSAPTLSPEQYDALVKRVVESTLRR